MFSLLVVLVKLSVLAKWLARKTPLRKLNRGEGIVSIKPRPKSAHDFLGLLYCFVVLLCIYVVSCPYVIYYPAVMAQYSAESAVKPQASKQIIYTVYQKLCYVFIYADFTADEKYNFLWWRNETTNRLHTSPLFFLCSDNFQLTLELTFHRSMCIKAQDSAFSNVLCHRKIENGR